MSARTLNEWLTYQESLHSTSIDLGLDRVQAVWQRMCADGYEIRCPVIVVGGTNGKGSTVACLEAIYQNAGYQTLAYTSPHIDKYNERIRIAGIDVDDVLLIEAFDYIDRIRAEISLSYFEFGTLAALYLVQYAQADVLLLEVGLGGRLDAVNILQHDIAIVTNIAMDHMEWLGDDMAQIAVEKAGIARHGKPLIIADTRVPESLCHYANEIGAKQQRLGQDIQISKSGNYWTYECCGLQYEALPYPGISGDHQLNNAAAAIAATQGLQSRLEVSEAAIRAGLISVSIRGRFEKISDRPPVYLDVAHNPAAAQVLAQMLRHLDITGRLIGVFALQSNREIASVIEPLIGDISYWHVAPLKNGLGHPARNLAASIETSGQTNRVSEYANVAAAMDAAHEQATNMDCIIVFGSFYTVSEARAAIQYV